MALAAPTFLITNATTYNTHATIIVPFTIHILQLLYKKGTSILYAMIKKVTTTKSCVFAILMQRLPFIFVNIKRVTGIAFGYM